MPTKLLIISDSPAGSTGLGRITRELSTSIHLYLSDKITVATLGMGGQYSSRLPWPQYAIKQLGANRELLDLPEVLRDFANGEKCVLFFIWNPGWLEWAAHPETCEDPALKECLTSGQFKRWIYAPIDAEGPNGLPAEIRDILSGFDRRLFYCSWAADLYDQSTEHQQVSEHLPHGIDGSVFYPRDRNIARRSFAQHVAKRTPDSIPDDLILCGSVMTNSCRKDIALAFDTVAELVLRGVNAALWLHTDSFFKEYDVSNLTHSFGLNGRVVPTKHYLSSEALAWGYSACDVYLGTGPEGWGIPLAEAAACGIPVIHMPYAGGAEVAPPEGHVDPVAWRYEGIYCHKRPVFSAKDWADRVIELLGNPPEPQTKFHWNNLWPSWSQWLLKGIE